MEKQNPTNHSMQRRMATHNYALPGTYHITLHVADGIGQPLGHVQGSLEQPDGSPDAPHVALTPVGNMVREELLASMSKHYGMISVETFIIMPEHLHALIHVSAPIVSSTGRPTHLGQVIAGFKKGCNRRYWAMTGQTAPRASAPTGEPPATIPASRVPSASPAFRVPSGSPASRVPSGSPAGTIPASNAKRTPSSGTTGRHPLFAYGYCDVQPITAEQLATQRAYIAANPRSRLLRSSQRASLMACRMAYTTALTPSALHGFLQRECLAKHATPEALAAIEGRLLLADGMVALDTYGHRLLLNSRLLPVVCHHKDKERLPEQKARCLEEAARGAVLVSARIAPGEQEIMNEMVNRGFPVILIADNGFPERFHPSAERIDQCAAGQLLLVTPWQYVYRGKNEQITIPFCKAMNCVAQALCRLKDDWWKEPAPMVSSGLRMPSGSPAPRVSSGSPVSRVSSGSPAGINK